MKSEVSLDSHAQIKKCIRKEFEDWAVAYNIDLKFEETMDLVYSVFDALQEGGAFCPLIPATVDADEEQYN